MVELPTSCPCCGSKLERVNDNLFCRNPDCSAQSSKLLEFFVKTIGVKGLGEKTLEKLPVTDITELYDLTEQDFVNYLGKAIGTKIYQQLVETRNIDLATLLAAFSIPLIGKSTASKLCTVITSVEDISPETCKQAGLGEKATANILEWLDAKYPSYSTLPFSWTNTTTSSSVNTESKGNVVITGKLTNGMSRNQAKVLLEQHGYSVKTSVTKTTNFLLCEEASSSSKTKSAEALGIPVVTLEYLLKE